MKTNSIFNKTDEEKMYSEKFKTFIDMWREEFAIERSIDDKVCVDKDGNPIPWYTYPAIEYLSQFDYSDKKIFEFNYWQFFNFTFCYMDNFS